MIAFRTRFLPCLARAQASQFSPLFWRPNDLADRHLDDAHRHQLAGLPAHRICAAAGLVRFAGQIPTFLFAPFAGVWVDRLDRHRVLVVTQALAMLQSFALAALDSPNQSPSTRFIALSACKGSSMHSTCRAASRSWCRWSKIAQDLANAIAINSSMVNMARLVGPSLAGILIAASGRLLLPHRRHQLPRRNCFAPHDAVACRRDQKSRDLVLRQLKDGWTYVSEFAPVRTILLLFAIISLMGCLSWC